MLIHSFAVDREQAVTTTIQLYNKARLLSSPNLMEVKVYLKASAAWMLTAYGGNKFKSMVSCIKLHCRSATELILYFPDDFIAAHSSLLQAIKNWTFVNNQAIERMISVVELEELRLYMFHCYVSLGRLQMKSNCKLLDDFKISLSAAMELVQSLPEMQFVFIEHAIAVGYYLSTHGFTLDSVPYFSRAISRIDMLIQCTPLDAEPEANQIRGHSWTIDDLNASKAKAYLSLAYIYSDLMYTYCYVSIFML